MRPVPASYSLIQYCPDPSRMELVNVGVIIHAPRIGRLAFRMADSDRRTRRLFGGRGAAALELEREVLAERLGSGLDAFPSDEAFSHFVSTRAGVLRLSPPRHMKVVDLDEDLDRLFDELVGEEQRPARQHGQAQQILDRALVQRGLASLVKHPVAIELPALKRTFSAQFSYRNGHLNLIEPVNFMSPSSAFDTACRRTIEGRAIADRPHPQFGPMRLVVVAHFSKAGRTEQEQVAATLATADVRLYDAEALEPLLDDIERHRDPSTKVAHN